MAESFCSLSGRERKFDDGKDEEVSTKGCVTTSVFRALTTVVRCGQKEPFVQII